MSKTNLTILDPVAYAEHLAEQNRAATAELKQIQQDNWERSQELQQATQTLLEDVQTAAPIDSSATMTPPQSERPLPDWFSFAVVAAIAASAGLFAGYVLSGGLL